MAYIYVNKSRLQALGSRAKQISAKVDAINKDFYHIGGRLDWDVKSASNIDHVISQLGSELEYQVKVLSKMSSFFNLALTEYSRLDNEAMAGLNKIIEPNVVTPKNQSIINSILGWFGKLTTKTLIKFIPPAIMMILPKGILRTIGIVGLNLNKKSLKKIFMDTMKHVLKYKRLNIFKRGLLKVGNSIFTQGFWQNVGKAIKSNATKNVVKWPYAKEFNVAKRISNLAKSAIAKDTGAKWFGIIDLNKQAQIKSAFSQGANYTVKAIKSGLKGAAILGAVTETGLGIWNGIKNKDSVSQIMKGVIFDAAKGALVGIASLAVGAAVVAAAPVLLPSAAVAAGVVAVGASIVAGAAVSSAADYAVGASDGAGGRFITNKNGEKITLRDWATGDNDSIEKYKKENEKVGKAVRVNIQTPAIAVGGTGGGGGW